MASIPGVGSRNPSSPATSTQTDTPSLAAAAQPTPLDSSSASATPEHTQFLGKHEVRSKKDQSKRLNAKEAIAFAIQVSNGIPAEKKTTYLETHNAKDEKHSNEDLRTPLAPRVYTAQEQKTLKDVASKIFRRRIEPRRTKAAQEHAKTGQFWSDAAKNNGLLKTAQLNFLTLKARILQTHDEHPKASNKVFDLTGQALVEAKELQEIGEKFMQDCAVKASGITFGLTSQEEQFLENILNSDLYLTHATRQDLQSKEQVQISALTGKVLKDDSGKPIPIRDDKGNPLKKKALTLDSRKRLVEQGRLPLEAHGNTQYDDIVRFKTDDYIFFSLEAGDHLQKVSSYFGQGDEGKFYRIKVDNDTPLTGGLLLTKDLMRQDDMLSEYMLFDVPAIKEMLTVSATAHGSPDNCVYPTDKLKMTIGLLVIEKMRQMKPEQQSKIYELSQSGSGVNSILNGLFRPQVLLPQSYNASKFEVTKIGSQQSYLQIQEELKHAKETYEVAGQNEKVKAFNQYKEIVNQLYRDIKRRIHADRFLKPTKADVIKRRHTMLEFENHLKAPSPTEPGRQVEVLSERDVALLWLRCIDNTKIVTQFEDSKLDLVIKQQIVDYLMS